MKVTVKLFAGIREAIGRGEVTLDLPNQATVADLEDRLSRDFPVVRVFLPTLVWAVNEDYVVRDHALREGDQVALIPPISGGDGSPAAGPTEPQLGPFEVTSDPLDPSRLVQAVRRDEAGAVVLFHGVVRNENEGRRVHHLEYEAYPSMATRKLRELAEEARRRWPLTGIGILHRIGRLAVGETALLIAVSAPHRRDAFEACHFAVDRIKQIVPIWKKEFFEGGEAWIEEHRVAEPEAARPEA